MIRSISVCVLLVATGAVAQPVDPISATAAVRARDADIPNGLDGDFASLNGLPASDTLAAGVGSSSSQATIDLDFSGDVVATLTINQAFDNSAGGTSDIDSASASATISFTPTETVDYVIAGNYDSVGTDGYSMVLVASLSDFDDPGCCLTDFNASLALDGPASLGIGVVGDGNAFDELTGNVTGTLVAGHNYVFQVDLSISNDASASQSEAIAPNNSAATATGSVTLTLSTVSDPDSDGDGIADSDDNCTQVPNASQLDTNADNIGNACDADLNGDCGVNFGDLALLKQGFFPTNNPDADFDGSGTVNFGDLAFMKSTFFNGANPGPGPSGLPNACD